MSIQTLAQALLFGEHYVDQGAEAQAPKTPAANPLEQYFDANREGPGIWKWRHYFEIYQRHFGKFVGKPVNVLEIGVGGGGSLAMWRQYFGPKSRIVGVDINEKCRAYTSDGVEILVGDQGDRAFWKKTRESLPPIDILIDDGSHWPAHQIATLEEMLPHMAHGGVYLGEDIYGSSHDFHDYVAMLESLLSHTGPARKLGTEAHEGMLRSGLQQAVRSIHRYPFLCVIEKHDAPPPDFIAPKHGTLWT